MKVRESRAEPQHTEAILATFILFKVEWFYMFHLL
jgi:hypothetical protein